MAMAVKSSLMYSGLGIQTPECWATSAGWDQHENLTEAWEWEDPNANANAAHHHLRVHSNDWSDRSVVTIASAGAVAGSSRSDELSSGIPGVAATRGSDSSSPLVKNEPDEVAVGTPATRNESFFVSLENTLSKDDGLVAEPERNDSAQNVTLKLGRRSYAEDSGKAPSLALSPPGKKQRPLSPTASVPRCQVEGCKADLSGCKDYHKRHKVCEIHSKAPKAIAGGIEQRFCQQCSRFHLLKEFDEGKRSCRRRLAGHNERRRKPHPETHSLFGMGNPFLHREISASAMGGASFYFPDIKPSTVLHTHRGSFLSDYGLHSYGHGLTRPSDPWSLKSRNDSIPAFQIQSPKAPITTLKPSPGLNLGGHHNFLEGSLGPLGHGLSLSSSTPTGELNLSSSSNNNNNQQQQQSHHNIGSCSQSLSQSVSGLMDSGRALSLLSSQSWAPSRPPQQAAANAQHPTSVSPGDLTLEQLVASSAESSNRAGSRFSHHLGSSTNAQRQQPFDKPFSSGVVEPGGLNFGLTATGNGTHERGGFSNMLASLGGYANANDSSSMLALVQGNQEPMSSLSASFGSRNSHHHQGAHATMDLMETFPSAASHGGGGSHHNNNNNNNAVQQQHSQVSSGGLYSGFATF